MNSNDGYDHAPDYDGCSEPRGTDPKIRRDGPLWFNFNGSWYQVGNGNRPPEAVRLAWLAEEMLRDRAAKEARV